MLWQAPRHRVSSACRADTGALCYKAARRRGADGATPVLLGGLHQVHMRLLQLTCCATICVARVPDYVKCGYCYGPLLLTAHMHPPDQMHHLHLAGARLQPPFHIPGSCCQTHCFDDHLQPRLQRHFQVVAGAGATTDMHFAGHVRPIPD